MISWLKENWEWMAATVFWFLVAPVLFFGVVRYGLWVAHLILGTPDAN